MPGTEAALLGGPGQTLTDEQVTTFISDELSAAGLDGRSVCVIVPDATRSCPLPLLLKAIHATLTGKVTVLVALGTHAEMSKEDLTRHVGSDQYDVLNHEWWKPDTFADLGTISAARVEEISGDLLYDEVRVKLNRAVVEHDVALVVGPVFPHEVVGFSGGNKYFFPGVAGQEVIDLSHWLGALITSSRIIGTPGVTPVRRLIDEAAALIPAEKLALSVVVESGTSNLHAVAFGDTQSSWRAAAAVSAETHVRYLDHPVRRVVSVMPSRYSDIWTAAKGFYKVEPVVADGGEVILYAPHVTQLAAMHPEIEEIGYHCRDYFVGQWDKFRDIHWGVLAHSTHLRGEGSWDPATGEHLRVGVTLATGIPEEVVRGVNLGYTDPASFDLTQYENDPDTLVVPNAGEILHRLR
ncbi:nickel-dependent lactate racemase [Kribbella sp. VKM Ac-2527]|uniref:Nickel-dependent lactate racemase n=1 Tax=Kribbella caucasensis TaxID=2512215 RepID=A0A4R6KC68_9ACTN|nr:lactate racemase domain-containing protein [Kribbella sp. VKM Ac-2527]TDO45936.1 nickel-dependent lactate racemase [Kribbella sp. VKM Ac-2527]